MGWPSFSQDRVECKLCEPGQRANIKFDGMKLGLKREETGGTEQGGN